MPPTSSVEQQVNKVAKPRELTAVRPLSRPAPRRCTDSAESGARRPSTLRGPGEEQQPRGPYGHKTGVPEGDTLRWSLKPTNLRDNLLDGKCLPPSLRISSPSTKENSRVESARSGASGGEERGGAALSRAKFMTGEQIRNLPHAVSDQGFYKPRNASNRSLRPTIMAEHSARHHLDSDRPLTRLIFRRSSSST